MNPNEDIPLFVAQRVGQLVRENQVFDSSGREIFEKEFGSRLNDA